MASLAISLAVAALLAGVGLFVLALRPNTRRNAWIAALLLLQAASTASYAALASAASPVDGWTAARLGVWASIPLPLFTVCLVHAVLPPTRSRAGWTLGLALVTSAALAMQLLRPDLFVAAVSPFLQGYALTSGPLLYALAVGAAGAQAYAVWHAERASRAADDLTMRRAALVALAFSLLPLHTSAFFVSYSAFRPEPLLEPFYLLRVAGTFLAAAVLLVALARLRTRLDRAMRRLATALLVTLTLLGLLDGVVAGDARAGGTGVLALLPGYERSVVVLRVVFALALTAAAVRFGTADMGARERRHTETVVAFVAGGLAVTTLAVIAILAVGPNVLGFGIALVAAAAVPAAGRRPLARTSRALARHLLLPPSDPRAIGERARTYASAVAAARGAGPEGERLLAQMRDDLGISLQEHELLVFGVSSRDEERYRRTKVLGHGTTAQVELAVDEVAGRRVVVKRFTGLRDPAAVLQEARSLAAVRHPRIVPFLEVDRRGDDVHLVLAFAEGGSARQLLDREGPLAPERALALTRDLLEGLAALHAAGIVHCDVKPENLLLDADGRGLLGDFGSARFVAQELADATLAGNASEGSLSTLSPEALRGARPAASRDVYAAGALLYRLLTGEHYVALADATAFQARERILLDEPRLPHPRIPAAIESVLRKALAKRPADRYQSAGEMRDALL